MTARPALRPRRSSRLIVAGGVLLFAALASIATAHAQGAGPFGVGAPEVGAETSAVGIFGWIAAEQANFMRTLTASLKAFRTDPHAGLLLIGISAIYGVFHAAGPGHGKAVIASYLIANRQTLKRGILLSFISAFFQGLVAVVFVSIARFVFDVTAVEMTTATEALELASALMITGLGVWLVLTKVLGIRIGRTLFGWREAPETGGSATDRSATGGLFAAAPATTRSHMHDANCGHMMFAGMGTPKLAAMPSGGSGFSVAGMVCADCGSTHMPDPAMIAGPMNWRKAIGAIAAVGVRPCTGAIIILVFAFSMRMYGAGIFSVLAMSLGTGITVSALAGLAVFMKDRAVRLAGRDSILGQRVIRAAEVLAAFGVLAMGSLLLGAIFFGQPMTGV